MNCPNCGAENPEEAKFCRSCGAPLPAKKKNKKPLIITLCVILAVLVAGGVLAALNYRAVSNFAMRSFAPPERYFQFILGRNAVSFSKSFSEAYESRRNSGVELDDFSENITLDFSLGDQVLGLLEVAASDSLGVSDLSWLSHPGLKLQLQRRDALMELSAELDLNQKTVLTAVASADAAGEQLWARVPQLNDSALALEAPEFFNAFREQTGMSFNDYLNRLSGFQKNLPDEALLRRVAARYLKLATEDLGEWTKGSGSLGVKDVIMDGSLLTVSISQEKLRAAMDRVYSAMQQDEDVKTLVEWFGEINGRQNFYQEFQDKMDLARDKVSELTLEQNIELVLWTDREGMLRGLELGTSGGNLLLHAPVRGNAYALILGFSGGGNELSFFGSGRNNGKRASGSFTLSMNGEDLLTLEVEDADSAVLKQGGFWGTLTLAPTREFYRQALNLSDAQARSMEDLSFRMQLSNDKTSATAHIAALWQGTEEYASVDCGVALKPAGALSVETSRLESSEWLRGFSEDKINAWISDLRSAGVPEELTEQLAQTLMLLVWMNR